MKHQDEFELKRALDALPRSIEPPADAWPAVRARIATKRGRVRPTPRAFIDWLEGFQPRTVRLAAGISVISIGLGVLGIQARANAYWEFIGAPIYSTRGLTDVKPGAEFKVGQVLVTPDRGDHGPVNAMLSVGTIGGIDVAPATRIRLLEAGASRHRLALERGMIHVVIDAPPRLFVVETPAGTAFDMGCEYTMHVDSAGNSVLHVDVGWVEFEDRGRTSLVPGDFMLIARPGGRVGIPVHEGASNQVRYAVRLIEDGGSLDSAVAILDAYALRRDAVTLWHAMQRVDGDHRELFHDILRRLQPAPAEVTYEGAMALDPIMLRLWWEALPGTLPITPDWTRRLWMLWLKAASWL